MTRIRLGPLVNGLTAAVALQWVGAGAVLPTLPVYLADRGAGPGLIGVAMGAFFVAGLLTQYPVGRIVDRVGERPVLFGGLLLYGLASVGFLLPVSPWMMVAIRFAQGVGAGAVEVASLAAIGRRVPAARRGSAFARIFGGQLGGLAIGPMLGALVGTAHLAELFVVSAVASGVAAVAVVRVVPAGLARAGAPTRPAETPQTRLRTGPGRRPLMGGLLAVAGIAGLTTGVYETCWTLLLENRGASTWAIGLSWTLFCVPYVVVTPLAGRLVDTVDRPRLVIASLLGSVVLVGVYPFVGSLPVVLVLGVFEAVGTAIAFPAAQAMLAGGVASDQLGRAQGAFAATQTGATALAASAGGALFGVAPALPFVSVGAVCLVLLGSLPLLWRRAGPLVATTGTPELSSR